MSAAELGVPVTLLTRETSFAETLGWFKVVGHRLGKTLSFFYHFLRYFRITKKWQKKREYFVPRTKLPKTSYEMREYIVPEISYEKSGKKCVSISYQKIFDEKKR